MIVLAALAAAFEPGASGSEDADALRRMAAGDSSGVRDLYDRHGRMLYSLALRVLADEAEAEEVVQDVFAQAWKQASRYDASRGAVGAWLCVMTRSRAIDRLRARRARPDHAGEADALLELPATGVDAVAALVTHERIRSVRRALLGLSHLQRTALELAYYEGLSQSEIAERLEQPLGTVKTRIRQGLLKLRDALSGDGA